MAAAMMAEEVRSKSEQFVPKREGDLRSHVEVTQIDHALYDITYSQPYAARMFFGSENWHYTEPGTGPMWTEKAAAFYLDDWRESAKLGFRKGVGL